MPKVTFIIDGESQTVEFEHGKLPYTHHGKPESFLDVAKNLGVPLELSDHSRVGSLAALSRTPGRFRDTDEQLFAVLARVLSSELERESSTRDLQRMSETLREHYTAQLEDESAEPRFFRPDF